MGVFSEAGGRDGNTAMSVHGTAAMSIHGDEAAAGARIDFAVNVRHPGPPEWMVEALQAELANLGAYPTRRDYEATVEVVADFHRCSPDEVLLVGGVAEGFSLLPALRPRRAGVIHPTFTEPELILADADVPITAAQSARITPEVVDVLRPCDVVVVGNPTNPTGILHSRSEIEMLVAPDRLLVVDEAFMDMADSDAHAVRGNEETPPNREQALIHSLAHSRPTGCIVTRSLTKSFSLAGLRCGYLLADPEIITQLERQRPPWPLGTLQLTAIRQALSAKGQQWLAADIAHMRRERSAMRDLLKSAGWEVAPTSAPFMLARVPGRSAQQIIDSARSEAISVRRTDTFPGMEAIGKQEGQESEWVRLAVRPHDQVQQLIDAVH